MKLRNGFVSNSSSCSFIVGTSKTDEEIYQDLFGLMKATNDLITYQRGVKTNRDITLEDIKEKVDILRPDEKGRLTETEVETWYIKEEKKPKNYFKGKVVIYSDDSNVPATEMDDFFYNRSLYQKDYEYYDGCTHMG